MGTLAATAARAAATTAASTAAAPPPSTRRLLPTLTACAVTPAGRRPFGAPLAATLRVTTHGDAAVAVAAAAAFEVDIAAGGGGDGGTVSPLAATPLATLAGDGAVHELALPLGDGLAALHRRLSADALCNVGLLHLALVVRRDAGEPPFPPPTAAAAAASGGGGGGGGPLTAAALAAVHEVSPPSAAAGGEVVVVAERSMAVEVFRDQRAGRVGGEDHDLLFRRVFVEE